MEFKILQTVFASLDPIKIGSSKYQPVFHYGSHADLLKFLRMKRKENVAYYPLVWVETPITLTGYPFGESNVNIVMATLSTSSLSNLERTDLTFGTTLNPLLDDVLYRLKSTKQTSLVDRNNQTITKYFNYDTDSSHGVPEIWDAISLKCTIRFNFNCKL